VATSLSSLYAPIERQNVELKLHIRPQINEGDVIRLEVEQSTEEIASVDKQLGPTTSKRSAKTTVMARDQETVVLGGLIQERTVKGVQKVLKERGLRHVAEVGRGGARSAHAEPVVGGDRGDALVGFRPVDQHGRHRTAAADHRQAAHQRVAATGRGATQRDRAGNRTLFFDSYCSYILLFLFNPVVTSLRGIQQASELKRVQKKLGCPRAALGSLS